MRPDPQKTADLASLTEESFHEKLHFLYGDNDSATLFEIPDINGMNTFVSKDRHLPIAVVGNCGILGYDNK